jgi:siroheme synthase-like protein
MRYYPALLDLKDRRCCVIGAGQIACRKARSLVSAGAKVTVISPSLSKGLQALVKKGAVSVRKDVYKKKYIRDVFLVVAATSDARVNRLVSCDALKLRILANVVDCPALSTFIVPAVLSKNGLIISISTSSRAPALSRRIKQDLRKNVLAKYSRALDKVSAHRMRLKKSNICLAQRKAILTAAARKALRCARP